MRYMHGGVAAFLAFGVLATSACGTNSTAATTPAVAAPASQAGQDGGIRNVSGEYEGSVKDSTYGTGSATGNLAQFRGSVGGSLVFTYGTAAYNNPVTALLSSTAMRGTFVATVESVSCSFVFDATYAKHKLAGKYHAVGGCSAETGSFSLTQQCFYTRDWALRRDNGLMHC
jgi:hypothetical protein